MGHMMYRTSSYAEGEFDYYLLEKDVFGNIVAVYNESGTKVVSYCYDAWGNCTVVTNTDSHAALNPFRYRGYYLDTETNLYYLQTRYYDSYVGRFINADGQLNGGLLGDNLFSYCENNPVMYTDPTGESILLTIIICAVVGAVIGFGVTAYEDYADDGEVFNGSVSPVDYVSNTAIGVAIGATVGYFAPEIGAFLTSTFSIPVLSFGGELVAVTVSGAEIAATGTAVLAASILLSVNHTGKSNGYWGEKYPNDHDPQHIHLKGTDGTDIRIGKDGNPLKHEPKLKTQQRKALKKLWNEIIKLFD